MLIEAKDSKSPSPLNKVLLFIPKLKLPYKVVGRLNSVLSYQASRLLMNTWGSCNDMKGKQTPWLMCKLGHQLLSNHI